MREIKIVPYEDKVKDCVGFNPCFNFWDDNQIKNHIINVAASENTKSNNSYKNLKKLIEVLETLDLEKFRNQEILLIFGDMYFICQPVQNSI